MGGTPVWLQEERRGWETMTAEPIFGLKRSLWEAWAKRTCRVSHRGGLQLYTQLYIKK